MTERSRKYLSDILTKNGIDNSIFWAIVKRHLQKLKIEISLLYEQY